MPIPRAYQTLVGFFRRLMGLFFREIEVTGAEHVPEEGGGIVVSWHPNGLVDPGLILTQLPRQVVFGARHGLFAWPILGALLKKIGTVPIFRATDAKGDDARRREANAKSVDALAAKVAEGSFAALFPEGLSHDEPYLKELKTGVARLYYRARELAPETRPVILPVGLHYDRKRMFRSRVLVWFHPPIEIDGSLEPEGRATEEQVKALTARITRELREVVHATEDWSTHFLLHRARKLVRAERAARAGASPGKPKIAEKALGFARVRTAYYARLETHPEQVRALRARLEEYDADIRGLRVDDHDLDRDPRVMPIWLMALLLLQAVLVFLLLPPVLVFGYLANAPTAVALWLLCKLAAQKKKDEATIKILVGALAFPATWLLAAGLGVLGHAQLHATYPAIPDAPITAGLVVALLAAVGGAAALRYLHVSQATARAVRVRLTRRRRRAALARLKVERAELFDALIGMAAGLELPGTVEQDGRVSAG